MNVILKMKEKEQIQFIVENNKINTIPAANHRLKSGGIGLANLDRRLKILYPNKHKLTINNNPKVYKVTLDLTL